MYLLARWREGQKRNGRLPPAGGMGSNTFPYPREQRQQALLDLDSCSRISDVAIIWSLFASSAHSTEAVDRNTLN